MRDNIPRAKPTKRFTREADKIVKRVEDEAQRQALAKLPKINAKALSRLRRAKTLAETTHGIGGVKKSGHFAPRPINLRLPPEKR